MQLEAVTLQNFEDQAIQDEHLLEGVGSEQNETGSQSITEITNVDTATVGDRSSNATHAAVVQVRFKHASSNMRERDGDGDGNGSALRDDDDKSLSTLTAGAQSIFNTVSEMGIDTVDIENHLPD